MFSKPKNSKGNFFVLFLFFLVLYFYFYFFFTNMQPHKSQSFRIHWHLHRRVPFVIFFSGSKKIGSSVSLHAYLCFNVSHYYRTHTPHTKPPALFFTRSQFEYALRMNFSAVCKGLFFFLIVTIFNPSSFSKKKKTPYLSTNQLPLPPFPEIFF